ncbi:MAG: glycosyltransferase family 4 protein [Candidatus Sulfopaludibacter sp.]|nr:glycosyltransferase family 4 protein [Candidatus Sulfopaludibacter sp.]
MHDGNLNGGRPLTVAFVSPSWPPDAAANGIVTYVDQMVASLRRMGHQPCILGASGSGQWPGVYFLGREPRLPLSRLLDPLAFRVNPFYAIRRRNGEDLRQAAARAIAECGVELLEMEETFGLLQLIRPRLPIPVVVRLHGPYFANAEASEVNFGAAYRRRVRQEGVTISLADAISAPSAEILERTRARYGLPLDGASVIPAPAPIVSAQDRWRLDGCDRSRILFLGRFDRHKGGDVVVDCFCALARNFPKLRLWFTGREAEFLDDDGRSWSLAEYLSRRAPEVAGRVDWLDRQPNSALAAIRRQAFLTIVASRYETFGLVALEAMAHGCPLVATRAGGIAETVTDGVNGMLCRPGDPLDMASQISRLLADPLLAAKLGHRAGEDAARRYHPDQIASETAKFHRLQIERWIHREEAP